MAFNPIQEVESDGLYIPEVGIWAERKYCLMGHYANVFTKAMHNQCNLNYIDMFGGAGYSKIRGTEKIIKSSTLISLTTETPFDSYVFNEMDHQCFSALSDRIEIHKNGNSIQLFNLDANSAVSEIYGAIPKRRNKKWDLNFCFLDPFSLNLEWSTVESLIRSFNRIDFLLLLALQMDAKRNFHYYIREENQKIEKFLGDPNWREKFESGGYTNKQFTNFLSDQYDQKMQALGYQPSTEKVQIHNTSGHGIYYLAFYSKANLGNKFFKGIQNTCTDQLSLF